MIVIISLISTLLLIFCYIIWNLLRKNEKQEDLILSQDKYIKSIYTFVKESKDKWDEMDINGAFRIDEDFKEFYENLENIKKVFEEYLLRKN